MHGSIKKHDIGTLNELYKEADQTDADSFANMRTNVLLVSGDHYARKNSKLWSRIRDIKQLSDEQKIRLTKNHIQKIQKIYANNVLSYGQSVGVGPRTENEAQDQKAADLNKSVMAFAKDEMDYDEVQSDWADDFTTIGELCTKLAFDPHAGPVKAYKQKTSSGGTPLYLGRDGKETEDPGIDMTTGQSMHEMAPGDPVFRGALLPEDIYGFNLLRPKNCKNLRKAEWLCVRKMVDMHLAMAWVDHDETKLKFLKPDEDKTYHVFDASTGGYGQSSHQVLIREFYFRACQQYPRGYYYITTEHGVLFEGELPFGKFPILVQTFDKVQTTPRGISIIKVLRPYQVEINRSASKMAEHQITLGDDKVLHQKGTQLTQSGLLPGVRGVAYAGKEPTILAGRDGSQYLATANNTIAEMYQVAMVAEENEEKPAATQDPYLALFQVAKQKRRFTRYTKRFNSFEKAFWKLYLSLAKEYFEDDMLIPMIGKREQVNIPEFRNTEEIDAQIKLEEQNDDVESRFGKVLAINHSLQYVGSKLDKEDIGRLMRAMPYGNKEASFDDFTLDYDTAQNMILALDRGQMPTQVRTKPDYIIKRLNKKMSAADFQFLPPAIQQNYQTTVAQYEQLMAEQMEEIKRAQAGFIPVDGYMVTVDMYVNEPGGKPGDPPKVKRARIPYSSLVWLIKSIEKQGLSQDALEGIDSQSQSHIAQQLNQTGGGNGIPPQNPAAAMAGRGADYGHGTITQPIFPGH